MRRRAQREIPDCTSHGDRDRGSTFIELLVSVVLLGTVGVAVLAATTAAIIGARTSDEIAKSQAVIAEVADHLSDTEPENVEYRDCSSFDARQEYDLALDAQFPGAVEVVEVQYQDASGNFTATCAFGAGHRLQQVELRSLVNDSERSMFVVKRPVDVPTQDTVPAPAPPAFAGGSGQATVSLTPGIN